MEDRMIIDKYPKCLNFFSSEKLKSKKLKLDLKKKQLKISNRFRFTLSKLLLLKCLNNIYCSYSGWSARQLQLFPIIIICFER